MIIVESSFGYKAYKAFFVRDSLRFNLRTGVLLFIALLSLGLSAYFFVREESQKALLFLLSAGAVPLIFLYGRGKQFLKTVRESGLREKSARIRYEINKDRILVINRTTGVQRTFKWAEAKRLLETKEYWIIYMENDTVMTFAKSDILEGEPGKLAEFYKNARAGSKKKKKSKGASLRIG